MFLFQLFYLEFFDASKNRFEQFCINYSNEKIQSFCTQRLISDELQWYKSEGLEVPQILFPGNEIVLGKMQASKFYSLSLLEIIFTTIFIMLY